MLDKHGPPRFHPSFYGPRYWPTWLLLGCFYCLGRLPIRFALAIGKGIGLLFYRLASTRRRVAATNIALCFPELAPEQQAALVREVLISSGQSLMESAMALWGGADKFRARHSIRGVEYLEQAQAAGQGVLLVACHLTTMDVAARVLSFYADFDFLYRKDPNPLLAYYLTRMREKYINTAIVRKNARLLVKRLRQGQTVWYAPDQDYGIKQGIFAPFFGIPAATVTATAKLAELGNAQVMPFIHYRNECGHYEVIIQPPLEGFPSGNALADATRINRVIEAAIRRQPGQYLWVHRRFKTRPAGEPDVYTRYKPSEKT